MVGRDVIPLQDIEILYIFQQVHGDHTKVKFGGPCLPLLICLHTYEVTANGLKIINNHYIILTAYI